MLRDKYQSLFEENWHGADGAHYDIFIINELEAESQTDDTTK